MKIVRYPNLLYCALVLVGCSDIFNNYATKKAKKKLIYVTTYIL